MSLERFSPITKKHLRRFAIIYARVSGKKQSGKDKGSVLGQLAQPKHAERLGWVSHLIKVIAEDLVGRTGSATAHRSGYIRILEMVREGLVGAIFLSAVDRIGRNEVEFGFLLNECIKHDVLIIVDGVVQDPKDESGWLQLRVRSLFAELENKTRCKRIADARNARIEAGIANGLPTVGYVYGRPRHKWVKDRNPRRRGAIEAIFRFYSEEGSCPATRDRLRAERIQIPARRPKRKIEFVDATPGAIRKFIRHPAYKGEIHSPRWVIDPTKDRSPRTGQLRTRAAKPGETKIIRNHHEPYVSPDEWDRNQKTLRSKAFGNPQRCYGDGTALLQKRLICEEHPGRFLSIAYKPKRADGSQSHGYLCSGTFFKKEGGPQCGRIPGNITDKAVIDEMWRRFSPAMIDQVEAELNQTKKNFAAERPQRKAELDRAHAAAQISEERFKYSTPGTLVAKKLENDWERDSQRAAQLENLLDSEPPEYSLLKSNDFEELCVLLRNAPTLFCAKTTRNHDRKQIVGVLVNHFVRVRRTREVIYGRIVWTTGEPDTLVEVPLPVRTKAIIKELLAQGMDDQQIADKLNEMGLVTLKRHPWSLAAVGAARRAIQRGG